MIAFILMVMASVVVGAIALRIAFFAFNSGGLRD